MKESLRCHKSVPLQHSSRLPIISIGSLFILSWQSRFVHVRLDILL
jgi:hypothetical protein